MFKKITDPLGVFFIRFLPLDRFHIFGVGEENVQMILENVKNRNPIFACLFHTDIMAVMV